MHKYLLISMLCMGIGGQFSATAATVKPVKKIQPYKAPTSQIAQKDKKASSSNINQVKLEKFLTWYETSVNQGKQFPDSLTKEYDKLKKHTASTKNPLLASRKKAVMPLAKAIAAQAFHKSHNSKSHHKNRQANCLKKYVIDCSQFGKKGVVITKPGYYCLAENVVYKPRFDHVPAITIQSHNVILDLSTHTLSQNPNTFNTFDDTSAIVVESGYNGITIKNGKIRNFSNCGVLVLSDNSSADDHFGIIIEDIVVNECGKITTATDLPFNTRSGIGVYGATDCIIQNCITSEITSLIDTEAIGTFFTDNLIIKNCISRANSSDPDQGFAEGIEVNFFNNAVIERCMAVKNTGSQAIGILPIFGTSLVVRECQGNENSSSPLGNIAFAVGIAIYFTDGGIFTNSQGNSNVAQGTSSGVPNFCSGIQVVSSAIDTSDCTANFNLSTNTIDFSNGAGTGFDINTVNGSTFTRCTAEGNTNDSPGPTGVSFGFIVDNTSNVLLEDCVAIANNPATGGMSSEVAGFTATIHPEGGNFESIIFKNCYSLNHSSDFAGTTVGGFIIGETPPTSVVVNPNLIILDSCVAEGNVNTATPGIGAGVSFEDGTTGSSVVNCLLKGNGVGILVRGANTISNLFEKNDITANSVYGIQDSTGNLNSYAKNYAYNPDALANYIGLPAFTPVRTWQIGFPPAPVDNNGILDPLDNISVTN